MLGARRTACQALLGRELTSTFRNRGKTVALHAYRSFAALSGSPGALEPQKGVIGAKARSRFTEWILRVTRPQRRSFQISSPAGPSRVRQRPVTGKSTPPMRGDDDTVCFISYHRRLASAGNLSRGRCQPCPLLVLPSRARRRYALSRFTAIQAQVCISHSPKRLGKPS